MKTTNLFWTFFWNTSLDKKYYWVHRLFWNMTIMTFIDGTTIKVKELWT